MALDDLHQCKNKSCWCKREKPASLGDVLFEIAMIKNRLDEATDLMFKICSDLQGKKITTPRKPRKKKQNASG